MLKVLVDPAIFRYGRCGLTRYYGALCNGLAQHGVELVIPLAGSNCDFQTGITGRTRWLEQYRLGAKLLGRVSRKWFHRLVRNGDYDCILVTSPEFAADFLEHSENAPFLMVVHDLMTCVAAPDGLYDAAGPGLLRLLALASRANHVVCISSDTRQALLRHGMVAEECVSVIRTGNLLAERDLHPAMPELPRRYLLFVGERSGRKGFYTLVRVLADIFPEDRTLHLICTGEFLPAEREFLEHHGVAERSHSIATDDSTLVALYQRAVCLVYPSLYEGFGLPVIEAMHYGCPVITTHCGALREVAAGAAIIIDPSRPEQLGQALRQVTTDAAFRERYIRAGHEHASNYSAGDMMRAFVSLFQEHAREPVER